MKKLISITLRLAFLTSLLAAAQAPAIAGYYGWAYNPLGSASWMYRALYPAYMFRGAAAYSPRYIASSAIYTGTWAASTIAAHRAQRKYYDPEPVNAPRERTQPVVVSPFVQDQIVRAKWSYPGAAQPSFALDNESDETADFNPVPAALEPHIPPHTVGAPTAITQAESAPPVAPEFQRPVTGSQPLASAFIEHVNSRFDGDIKKALKDRSTQKYAKALGIECESNRDLSEEKVNTVKKLLADNSEDASTRISALRLILKH